MNENTAIREPGFTGNRNKNRNATIPGLIRRLSNGERKFLWSPVPSVSLAARITGNVDGKKLRQALETVRCMHPLLGARVIRDENHDAYFSSDNVPSTVFRISERKSDNQWFDEILEEHRVPMEPETGPLIRFVLVHSPKVSEIIVFAAHTICDGTSLANLVREILDAYADPGREVTVIRPPLIAEYLPKKTQISLGNLVKSVLIRYWNRQWRKRPHYFGQADYNAIHAAYWEKYRYRCVLLDLEKEAAGQLTAWCRENGVTVTPVMTAAFLAAYEDVAGPLAEKDRSIAIPFDLRRHLKITENFFCFFVGGFHFRFAYDYKKPFRENVQDLHRIISSRKNRVDDSLSVMGMEAFEPTLLDAFVGFAGYSLLVPDALLRTEALKTFAKEEKSIAWSLARGMGSRTGGTIMTNLGRLDFPATYGNLCLDRIFAAPCASETVPLILAGLGVSGTLTFTVNFVERTDGSSRVTMEDMIRVRNRALEYLGFPHLKNTRAME